MFFHLLKLFYLGTRSFSTIFKLNKVLKNYFFVKNLKCVKINEKKKFRNIFGFGPKSLYLTALSQFKCSENKGCDISEKILIMNKKLYDVGIRTRFYAYFCFTPTKYGAPRVSTFIHLNNYL